MANFHHTTPIMENATVPQRPGPIQLQQVLGSYHGSQSCPSSGYPALSETHYHPSQVLTSAQQSAIEHTPLGGTNAGPYHPTGPPSTHNPVYPPGHTVPTGHSAPQDMVILLKVHLSIIWSTHRTHDHLMPFPRWVVLICPTSLSSWWTTYYSYS